MDLHDGVIQSIYAVGLMLEDAQYRSEAGGEEVKTVIARAIEGLNDVIRDLRNYILDLRPQRFQGRHLPEGLAELAREARAHSFLNVDLQIESVDWTRLSPEHTVEILHIAREALMNVRKHSRASSAEIILTRQPQVLALTIADNGMLKRESDFEMVSVAANSVQTLQEAKSKQPDLLLMDPMMRDGLGLATLRHLRADLPNMIVVVFTAVVDTTLNIQLQEMGIKHILAKGVLSSRLLSELRSAANTLPRSPVLKN